MTLWTALLLGVVGSLHCAGMCGPLVLALPIPASAKARFLVGRLAYNAGRIATYCVLGFVFGLVGRSLVLAGVQRCTSIGLCLILFTRLFLSRYLTFWLPICVTVEALKSLISGLFRRRSFSLFVLLGLLMAVLPSGLLSVA